MSLELVVVKQAGQEEKEGIKGKVVEMRLVRVPLDEDRWLVDPRYRYRWY